MRQMLQQQVEAAGSWQQLQQLLEGRKEQLTLKHISTMVVQVSQQQQQRCFCGCSCKQGWSRWSLVVVLTQLH
jgi:hypothetical protein